MAPRRPEGNGVPSVHSSLTKLAASSEPGCLSFLRRYAVACSTLVGILVLVVLMQGQDGSSTSSEISLGDQVRKEPKAIRQAPQAQPQSHAVPQEPPKCSMICDARQGQYTDTWGVNLLDRKYLVQTATRARKKLHKQLEKQYGIEFFQNMLQESTQEGGALKSGDADKDISTKRFRRKLLMKLLKAQISLERQERDVLGCDCTKSRHKTKKEEINRQLSATELDETLKLPPLPASYGRFVWSTGGHSAAAGHGNLFNESYTAVFERSANLIFSSLGLEVEGRNFAMGGTPGAPEIALCSDAIFGNDIDVISWDFGMMENDLFWKLSLYGNRAGLNPSRPAVVGLRFGEENDYLTKGRVDTLKTLEKQGLTTLYMDDERLTKIKSKVPNMFGMTSQEIQDTPEYIRNYRCNDDFEKGDPTCGDEKYSKDVCPDREHKAPWHPGWKEHALAGNVLGLYVTDMVVDAVKELAASDEASEDLLAKLIAREDADYIKFLRSTVPDPPPGKDSKYNDALAKAFKTTTLFRSPSICRTARLPSETRFRGILTETDGASFDNFDNGLSRTEADIVKPEEEDKGVMPLVAEDQKHKDDCSVRTKIDRKDYFYNKMGYGWRSLTIPSAAEQKEYARGQWNPQGIVIVCWSGCDWGECPNGELRWEGVYNGTLKVEINGQPVINMTSFETKESDCVVLGGEQGNLWKANDAGQYELRTKLEGAKDSYTRISSFLVM